MSMYASYAEAQSEASSINEYLQELHEELVTCSSEATARAIREKIREAHAYLHACEVWMETRN